MPHKSSKSAMKTWHCMQCNTHPSGHGECHSCSRKKGDILSEQNADDLQANSAARCAEVAKIPRSSRQQVHLKSTSTARYDVDDASTNAGDTDPPDDLMTEDLKIHAEDFKGQRWFRWNGQPVSGCQYA